MTCGTHEVVSAMGYPVRSGGLRTYRLSNIIIHVLNKLAPCGALGAQSSSECAEVALIYQEEVKVDKQHADVIQDLRERAEKLGSDMGIVERFLSKTEYHEKSGCLMWAAAASVSGYGGFSMNGKIVTAHRTSYLLFIGEVPSHLILRHTCNTRTCVNVDHLLTGTVQQNSDDRRATGQAGDAPWPSLSVEEEEVAWQLSQPHGRNVNGLPQQVISDSLGPKRAAIGKIIRKVDKRKHEEREQG